MQAIVPSTKVSVESKLFVKYPILPSYSVKYPNIKIYSIWKIYRNFENVLGGKIIKTGLDLLSFFGYNNGSLQIFIFSSFNIIIRMEINGL